MYYSGDAESLKIEQNGVIMGEVMVLRKDDPHLSHALLIGLGIPWVSPDSPSIVGIYVTMRGFKHISK